MIRGNRSNHAAQLWFTWNILYRIEKAENNPQAAAAAKAKAAVTYLAYRRDGGENYEFGGQLYQAVLSALQSQDTVTIQKVEKQLAKLLQAPEVHEDYKVFIPKLQSILQGSRDPALAQDPALHYSSIAELQYLLECLK